MMPSLHVEDSGYVCGPRDAARTGRQSYFPSILECNSLELIVSFDAGTDMEAADVRTWTSRSRDGGNTWGEPARICDPSDSESPSSTLGRIGKLRDGSLVGVITVCDRSQSEFSLANPETEGFVNTRFGILQSFDDATTWTPLRWIEPPIDWCAFETCSPIHEVNPNRWILPSSIWRRWDGDCTPGMKAVAFVSDDRGVTWDRCVDVMDMWAERVASWEQKQARLTDGRLLAVCWAFSYADKKSLRNRYAFSDNDGDLFGPPIESPLHGETCTPLALPGNHILCAYRRVDIRGLWAHLARIDGDQWAPISDTPLWGTDRASYGAQSDNKLEEMSTLQFGYPQMIRLSSGDIMVVFWCVEDGVACVRWIRLRTEGL